MIRLVLFDIDGTLIRTGGAGVKAFARTFATAFNVPDATRGLNFAGRTDPSLVRECFGSHDIDASAENFRRFFDAYVFWLHDMLSHCQGAACAGVREFIGRLESLPQPPLLGLPRNIRLGLKSSSAITICGTIFSPEPLAMITKTGTNWP